VEIELLHKTRFEGPELRKWYVEFCKEYSHGEISKKQFVEENISFTKINDEEFWEHIFDVIDVDKTGKLSFVEWISLLSCVNRGSQSEQLALLFYSMDIDGCGFLTRDEVTRSILLISKIAEVNKPAAVLCSEIFSVIDLDKDEKISYKEFHDGLIAHEDIRKSLDFVRYIYRGYLEGGNHVEAELI